MSVSPTGIVTIGWSVSMKTIENPKMIPTTKVGVKSELLQDENSDATRSGRRSLSSQGWYKDSKENEQISLDILDALEINFVSNDLDLEEEDMVKQSIEWNLLDFSQDFIKI